MARLAAAGIRAELRILSKLPHHEVPVWMGATDLLLCTSASEGSPNIVKEALACGLPIVSTDVGDVRERIGTVSGCRVVEADPVAIAVALREVCAGGGRVDCAHAVTEFSSEVIARQVLSVYHVALGIREPGRPRLEKRSISG